MLKKAQVIMLPTENKSSIWSHKGRRLYYNQNNPNDVDDEIRYNSYFNPLALSSVDGSVIDEWNVMELNESGVKHLNFCPMDKNAQNWLFVF